MSNLCEPLLYPHLRTCMCMQYETALQNVVTPIVCFHSNHSLGLLSLIGQEKTIQSQGLDPVLDPAQDHHVIDGRT